MFIERFLIFAVVAGPLLLGGCGTLPVLEKPRLELAGLRIDHMAMHDPQIGLILRAHNPNAVSVPLKQVSVAVELNERLLAEGESSGEVMLPAHGSALVELLVHAHTEVLWASVKDMIHTPGGGIRYRLHGTAVVSSLDLHFPFDTPGSIDFDTLLGRKRSNPAQ